jgi:hypothetical protein
MRIAEVYSHLNGEEWMMVRRPQLLQEIHDIVAAIDAEEARTKISKEARMKGKALYAPKVLNERFKEKFTDRGWDSRQAGYWVTDDHQLIRRTMGLEAAEQKAEYEAAGKAPIWSYNQTDFVKERVAVEVQFGKYAFIAYDMFVKHMAFYVNGQIDVGLEVLPMKSMQSEMSSGPGYYEGTLYDLVRQGRGNPAVPLVLIGIEP